MNSRTRNSPARGEISFRKERPIWADAKGIRPLLNSSRREKLRKWPWAVSGRRKLSGWHEREYKGNSNGLPGALTGRTNATGKHEIKLLWFAHFVVSIWIPNVMLPAELGEL